jgi:hypothetical protein
MTQPEPPPSPPPDAPPSPQAVVSTISASSVPEAAGPEEAALPPIPKRTVFTIVRDYFVGEEPTLLTALVPTCLLSIVLYARAPSTNFIFDEQEALLANPYVRAAGDPGAKIGWLEAFHRDFWGLTPDRTIGSYRPLPDILWRVLWKMGARDQGAFPHDYVNLMIHGLNGALMVVLVLRWTRDRVTAWLAGGIFVAAAVVTEAVSGVVGLADVLGGTGALLALLALNLRLAFMPLALFWATMLGLYSKESALCLVPLVPAAALLTAQITHPERPLRWLRAGVAALTVSAAFVFYVEARRRWFPVATPHELSIEANADKPRLARFFAAALRWYAQPMLPHDPLNNPLIKAETPYRVAGALRVYARGLGQVIFPRTLSGDYSAPQEPIPDRLVFPESVFGGAAMVLPLLAAPVVGFASWWRGRRAAAPSSRTWRTWQVAVAPLVAFALVWIVVSYFPVSNIPVKLPTVRAERFWYFPAIGSSIVLALFFRKLFAMGARYGAMAGSVTLFVLFLGFQCFAARWHALDYKKDLAFWDATRKAVPRSAKAHLNYSVMLGARGDLEGRLVSNGVALELAPEWPMASVYEGDTLCRLHRAPEAVPHYLRGFDLNPNDQALVALGLQCLWDEGQLADDNPTRGQLQDLGDKYPGSWLKFLVDDILESGYEHKGVNPKYRPRGYNEGPKKDE